MLKSHRILFVSAEIPDDETRRTLETRGFGLIATRDFETATEKVKEARIDSVVVDLERGAQGVDFIDYLRETEATRAIPVLVLGEWGTGRPSLALSHGADAYERTPIDAERLVTSIERLLAEPRLVGIAASGSE